MSTASILNDLNPEQAQAVTHKTGPLLIIAGAGTGKTTVITRRIAWLVNEGLAKTNEILALTFTDKAAKSMQEKVDILVPYGYIDIWISTFHAFGDRLLRENALELGLTPDFKVLTRPEAAVFFREHLFEFGLSYYRPLSDPTRFIEALLDVFSRAKDEDINWRDYREFALGLEKKAKEDPGDLALREEAVKHREIAESFAKYQELLLKEGKIDFGNQFYLALELLRKHPSVLRRYQEQFKYILIDEFQDTNFAQFQLVKLLAGKNKNVTCVADDDQCVVKGSWIDTPEGKRRIENVKKGDVVLTAVGKAHVGTSKVRNVFKKVKLARLLTFTTSSGNKIKVTSNHKMFCYVPTWSAYSAKGIYYVYLMWRKDIGWRLGTTNDLALRLRLERSADKIVGLRSFNTEQQAQYFETYLSLKYGIPTVYFMRRKGAYIVDEWVKKLYQELDTEKGVKQLVLDLDIDLNFHHHCLGGVVRGNKSRVLINLYLCYRKHISKERKGKLLQNPLVSHMVSLETSDNKVIAMLLKAGVRLRKAKRGMCLRRTSTDLKEIEDIAYKLKEITGGILEYRFNVGRLNFERPPALIMPASNVLAGHYLPVRKGYNIVYERVVSIKEEKKKETVYDLEIERTHNFIVNGIVVHNCIYRWRGAAYSNILNFVDEYPDARKVALIQNYRSTKVILDSSYQLIQHNNPERFEVKSNIDKKLIAQEKNGPQIKHLHFDTLSTEADNVAKIISDKVKKNEFKYSDFAILVRANNDAEPFLRGLNMLSIPWRFSGNQGLYSQPEVRLCVSFLRVMANIHDSLSLYYLAVSEIYQLAPEDLSSAMHLAKRRNRGLYFILENLDNEPEIALNLSDEIKEKIRLLISDIRKFLKLSAELTSGRLLYQFLTDTGLLKSLISKPSVASEEKLMNLAKFFDLAHNYEGIAKEDRVIYFINYLNLLIEAGDDPATAEADMDIDAVHVLTIHKAKGLEFEAVFLVSTVMGKFPCAARRRSIELPDELLKDVSPSGDFHTQEERRLFYVGMTRAKKELYFTSASDYGGSRVRKVSQFVLEALGTKEYKAEAKKSSAFEAIQRHAPKPQLTEKSLLKDIEKEQVLSLSYYQIDDYRTCPLKYKFVHVLRVPIMEHHTVLYGKALHDCVQKYFQYKAKDIAINKDELIQSFLDSFKQEGFLDVRHQEERANAGALAIERFFLEQEKIKSNPTYVEKEFTFILDNNRVTGRWDMLYLTDEESRIVDFKSSNVKKQADADKKAEGSLQLSIYAMAFKHVFAKLPDWVELHFLESGLIGRAKRTENDFKKAAEIITEASGGIRGRDFEAKPAYLACTYCAFSQICPSSVSGA